MLDNTLHDSCDITLSEASQLMAVQLRLWAQNAFGKKLVGALVSVSPKPAVTKASCMKKAVTNIIVTWPISS